MNIHHKISLDHMAKQVGMDRYGFIRLFRREIGLTPIQYVLNRKIIASKKILISGAPIADAAYTTGFYDQSHFSNCFKRITGVTPLEFQKACNILQDK